MLYVFPLDHTDRYIQSLGCTQVLQLKRAATPSLNLDIPEFQMVFRSCSKLVPPQVWRAIMSHRMAGMLAMDSPRE